MIVFIPFSGDGCKPGEYDQEWLPRDCPGCGEGPIIGHGRRRRVAHDHLRIWIRVRRGLCNHCHRTLTALPAWCVPHAAYSLAAREQAMTRLADGRTLEQAAPDCLDPDRVADSTTVRRGAGRRMVSFLVCTSRGLFCPPTILAWDFSAVSRILSVEHASP